MGIEAYNTQSPPRLAMFTGQRETQENGLKKIARTVWAIEFLCSVCFSYWV